MSAPTEAGIVHLGPVTDWTAGTVTETEPPELREGVNPEDVSPGVLGFLVIFAVVLACIPLFRSMTSKLRGVDHRERREAGVMPTTDRPDAAAGPDLDPGPRP